MVDKLQNTNWRDIGIRAFKTFIQAFISVGLAGLAGVVDWESGKVLLIAAGAAGISAVWNFIKETL